MNKEELAELENTSPAPYLPKIVAKQRKEGVKDKVIQKRLRELGFYFKEIKGKIYVIKLEVKK